MSQVTRPLSGRAEIQTQELPDSRDPARNMCPTLRLWVSDVRTGTHFRAAHQISIVTGSAITACAEEELGFAAVANGPKSQCPGPQEVPLAHDACVLERLQGTSVRPLTQGPRG